MIDEDIEIALKLIADTGLIPIGYRYVDGKLSVDVKFPDVKK